MGGACIEANQQEQQIKSRFASFDNQADRMGSSSPVRYLRIVCVHVSSLSGRFAMDSSTVQTIAAHRLAAYLQCNQRLELLSAHILPVVQSDWILGALDSEWRISYQRPGSEKHSVGDLSFQDPIDTTPSLLSSPHCLVCLSLSSPPALSLLCTTLHRPELLDK